MKFLNNILNLVKQTKSYLLIFVIVFIVAFYFILKLYVNDIIVRWIAIIFLAIIVFFLSIVIVFTITLFIYKDIQSSIEKKYDKIIKVKDNLINQLNSQINYAYENRMKNIVETITDKGNNSNEQYKNSVSKNRNQTENIEE